jgi:hypothetical protein
MSHKKPRELAFGSDSFLDVLCNMVGILVILIVVAGLRIVPVPAIPIETGGTQEPSRPTVLDDPIELGEPQTMVWAVEAPPPEIPSRLVQPRKPAKLAPLNPPQELVDATSSMQADLESLTAQIAETEAESEALAQRSAEAETEVASARSLVATVSIDQQSAAELALLEKQDLATLRAKLTTLETELREARTTAPKVKILKHSTTPISQFVNGTEVHCRLIHGKVSIVPVDILVERLQASIQRQKEFLLSREYFESSVGPVDGYEMVFVLERAKATPVEELNMGGRIIRMEVTSWTIRPDSGIVDETAEQALVPGSHFMQAIETAGSNATLTFWVYPDSFEAHRTLQDHVQAKGWRVAARPLPEGVPIAGSPKGSKSLAQ